MKHNDLQRRVERIEERLDSLNDIFVMQRENLNIDNLRKYNWSRSLVLIPRRCYISGLWIGPFTYAMYGHRFVDGPGETIVISKWIAEPDFIMAKLKDMV